MWTKPRLPPEILHYIVDFPHGGHRAFVAGGNEERDNRPGRVDIELGASRFQTTGCLVKKGLIGRGNCQVVGPSSYSVICTSLYRVGNGIDGEVFQ